MNAGKAALIIYSSNLANGEQHGVVMGMRPIVIGMICAAFLASAGMGSAGYGQRIREDDLRSHIKILASDEFEGRAPGTPGEQKTIAYITQQWQKAGLSAASQDGSWLQPVPLIRRGPAAATLLFHAKGNKLRFADDEAVLIGREASYMRDNLPLWFAGYGIRADGKVAGNVAGKAVLILADRPGFVTQAMQSVRARREALVASGAEAVIIIGGEQAEYPLIRQQLLSRPISLASREVRAPLEGVIGAQFAVAMVTAAGGDWDTLRKAANSGDFDGVSLGITGKFDVKTDVQKFDSYNVIGKIAGTKPGSGAVLYMGHWDHLGLCRPEGDKDRICNGAIDNASGIAVLTEVARTLSKGRHDRDIYFMATTAEESGLLGAYAFAANPPVPLDDIVVALNIDTIAVAPRGAKVAIVGRGLTRFDAAIETVAKKLRRKMEVSLDANAFVERQDGWVLTQQGVPAMMVGGAFADMALLDKFLSDHYHGPDDELTRDTQLGGAAEDAMLHVELGKYFANAKNTGTKTQP
jgi:Peptidase family M28